MRQEVECESLSKETLGARILLIAGKSGAKQNYSSKIVVEFSSSGAGQFSLIT